ncbi:MAG: UDP-N-acetylmuramoyl-L-alanyl-D-glutamate--2,6-diaminopimelate ligase [Thermodesulfobacteriota bacterium]|nr:UDP-N-acetylmuramoyl-L-alanyl-D-glutamate--2,6-diaminopimelate ligase [Thermodesulfobacteriota bacterium]
MKLNDLLKEIEDKEVIGNRSLEVSRISYNSKDVVENSLFIAIKGSKSDGHTFISEAISKGARAVVVEKLPKGIKDVTVILTYDTRLAMAKIAARFYNDPSSDIVLVGITGTNGKTTTAYLVESIFEEAGLKTGMIGTINYHYGEKTIPASMTTPESLDIQRILSEMAEDGVTHVVMEVSSHALDLKRVESLHFNAGLFTNLTQDHLDYHQTMEHYFRSKAILFNRLLAKAGNNGVSYAILNEDDPYSKILSENTTPHIIHYGVKNKADVFPVNTLLTLDGISAEIETPKGTLRIKSPLIGEFNLYNILAAIGVGISQKIPLNDIKRGIESLDSVPGRFERIESKEGIGIIVDYAHTGDALKRTLETIKSISKGRIITVFGCGGDRDKLKRPIMGAISGKYSDLSIITSDNPRTENPNTIIEAIKEGMEGSGAREYNQMDSMGNFSQKGYITIVDRLEAIRFAIDTAKPRDTVLIAGKGHEDYQITGDKRTPFNDRKEARNAIAQREKALSLKCPKQTINSQ